MLEMIHIENFVLAKNITMELRHGFNVFSGETGAGKTLIINAIRYGMGETFSKEIFGTNLPFPHVQLLFNTSGIDSTEQFSPFVEGSQTDILCERWMTESGKSRVKINGKLLSLPEYQVFCKNLVNIHGQNSLDDLMSRRKQIFLFDTYFKEELKDLLLNFAQKRKAYIELIQDLEKINETNIKREREIDFINYQIQEIESAKIRPGEWEEIKKVRDMLANSQNIMTSLRNATSILEGDSGNDESRSLIESLGSVTNLLIQNKDFSKELGNISKIALDCESIIKDLSRDIVMETKKIENQYDEQKLNEVINRIDQISHILRKYGTTEEEVLAYKEKIENELKTLVSTEEIKEKKTIELTEVRNFLIQKAESISTKRKSLRPIFEKKVNQELKDLSMENATLTVEFSTEKDDSMFGLPWKPDPIRIFETGIDRIEFKIKTNPGSPNLPIAEIASGGELSRIMLAIKTIIGTSYTRQTLIFDEIDSGIGGSTGNAIGNKLRSLGEKQQIICITHLPQIASKTEHHFHIEKNSCKDSTEISIHQLNKEERTKEIARMLDGNLESLTSLQHAREMIES